MSLKFVLEPDVLRERERGVTGRSRQYHQCISKKIAIVNVAT